MHTCTHANDRHTASLNTALALFVLVRLCIMCLCTFFCVCVYFNTLSPDQEWLSIWRIPFGRKFWWGIYFGGLAALTAIRQYFTCENFTVWFHHTVVSMMYNRAAAGCTSVYILISMEQNSCVWGHHVSKEFWTMNAGEELACQCKKGNPNDVYVFAVKTCAGIVVSYLLRKISAACSLFLCQSGTVVYQIAGSRRASSDLPQGSLEVPCSLKFVS